MSLLLLLSDSPPLGADISFNGPMLALPYSLQRLGFTFTRSTPKSAHQNGAFVTLSANQFGTTYDAITGLYAFEAEPAATNLALNSILAGGGAVPTSWTQPMATGTSAPVASVYGAASGAVAYLQTATAQRPCFSQTIAISASTTYTASIIIESVSGSLAAQQVIGALGLPAGAASSFLVCAANPSGNGSGVLTTGELKMQVVVSSTAGTCLFRFGVGVNANATGTLQFSRPQFETGLRRTSWIATAGSTVTRAADVLSCATANAPGFNAAGYTLVADYRRDIALLGVGGYMLAVHDGSANNLAATLLNSASNTQTYIGSGGVQQSDTSETTVGTARNKIAFSVKANSFLRAINGVAGTADMTGAMPVAPTTFTVGASATSALQFNGFIYGFKLIPVALNQAQTTALTS